MSILNPLAGVSIHLLRISKNDDSKEKEENQTKRSEQVNANANA